MKTKCRLIILVLILFSSDGFAQIDSSTIVSKKKIKKFHTKIFNLPVDTTIDSSAVYQLIYLSKKGWSQGYNNPNPKKKYHSSSFLTFDATMISIAEILKFGEPKKKTTTLLPINYIVHSRQDNYFKKIKNKKYNTPFSQGVISLGGKYLLVATKNEYIGNTSRSSTEYHYYEKIK